MSKTITEMEAYISAHCKECMRDNLEWCIKNCTIEERDAYAEEHGCICGCHCRVCRFYDDCID